MGSGIYAITNTTNGHCYIGSTLNFRSRWALHIRRLETGIHHAHHLQSAWKKYGSGCFIFEIIERCGKHELLSREQYFIDTLRPEYNTSPTAGSRLGVKDRPETIAKKSASAFRGELSDKQLFDRKVASFYNDLYEGGITTTKNKVCEFLASLDRISEEYNGRFDPESIAEMDKKAKQSFERCFR